jgi:hypothetical protein
MKAKCFIKIFPVLIFGAALLLSSGYAAGATVPVHELKHTQLKTREPNPIAPTENPYLTLFPFESGKAFSQSAHKTLNPFFKIYTPTREAGIYTRCLNFFSGHNDQRFELSDESFLYPFHGFW